MWKTPEGAGGTEIPIGPTDTVRFVTNDFMYTGGDGYTAFAAGTDVLQPGDDLMQVTVDYITANSPVAPVVDGKDHPARSAVSDLVRAGRSRRPTAPARRTRLRVPLA